MAPRARYRSPVNQLAELLIEARRRGVGFDQAWDEAMATGRPDVLMKDADRPEKAVRWSTDRTERNSWRAAFSATKEAWRRAYDGAEPVRGEAAVCFLADAIGAAQAMEREPARPARATAAA